MSQLEPRSLLVGEAAGYRGCRLTGIPFTSEQIIMNSVAVNGPGTGRILFGSENGYRLAAENRRPLGEATATVVWAGITKLEPIPLLWNAFPFHPHQAGRPQSNRRPSSDELSVGRQFMLTLLELFNLQQVIAVGRVAEKALKEIGLTTQYVRHPSHGGRQGFLSALSSIDQSSQARVSFD